MATSGREILVFPVASGPLPASCFTPVYVVCTGGVLVAANVLIISVRLVSGKKKDDVLMVKQFNLNPHFLYEN